MDAVEFDLKLMRQAISRHRTKLANQYGVPDPATDPYRFTEQLIDALDQRPIANVLEVNHDASTVFRAAVRSIGSNSAAWTKYLAIESTLADLLYDFDPVATAKAEATTELTPDHLAAVLPGQYKSGPASAILASARLLAAHPDYYGLIRDVGRQFRALAPGTLDDARVMLCVASYFAASPPPARWRGESGLTTAAANDIPSTQRKFPGMLHPLASEFLRNLGWTGFKPDRHIVRLLSRWLGESLRVFDSDADVLTDLIGKRDQPTLQFLRYGLAGLALTPDGVPYSEADNIVWLLAANVERKGKETSTSYLRPRA